MLLPDFFAFSELKTDGILVKTQIVFNPAHAIFAGHFPGQPVVPGVCMPQMVKEVLEAQLGFETRLLKASELKFLSIINPEADQPIQMELKVDQIGDQIGLTARLLHNETVLFKFKGVFAKN